MHPKSFVSNFWGAVHFCRSLFFIGNTHSKRFCEFCEFRGKKKCPRNARKPQKFRMRIVLPRNARKPL